MTTTTRNDAAGRVIPIIEQEFEDFRTDLEGPSIALITQSGHQGRPVFQGQEVGIRLTHWAPTGNEVDLEFADFARHFADQPETRYRCAGRLQDVSDWNMWSCRTKLRA